MAAKTERQAEFVRLQEGDPAPSARSIALVPGAAIPVLSLDLPKGLRGPAREQVARRQVRDRLGLSDDRIEMRPFGIGGAPDGWTSALVADRALLETWRDAAGPACRAVLPDYLALPAAPKLWTLRATAEVVEARLGLNDGFSTEPAMALLMLRRALDRDGAEAPSALLQLDGQLPGLAELMAAHDVPVIADSKAAEGLGLTEPQVLAHGETALDLRSDPQAARNRLRRRVLPWRLPVLLTLITAGLWATAQITEIRALRMATAAQQAETLETTRAFFVPTGPILDIRGQVAQALARQRAGATQWQARLSPLDLFADTAGIAVEQEALPELFTYAPESGLLARFRVADFAAVDRLVAALVRAGLAVEVLESRVSEEISGVRVDLRLQPDADAGGGE